MSQALVYIVFCLVGSALADDTRTRIAIVDTGMNQTDLLTPFLCRSGHQDYSGMGPSDAIGHGTAVAELAVKGLDPRRFCVVNLKWMHWASDPRSNSRVVEAIRFAVENNAHYLNLSLSGTGDNPEEQIAIQDALSAGMVVVIAAGNEGVDLSQHCDAYPACYPVRHPNLHVVASISPEAHSNYGGPVTDWEAGGTPIRSRTRYGTSFAAPRVLNKLIKGGK